MITMADIQAEINWNSIKGSTPNLESNMDFAEHQRIASDALKLLAGKLDVPDNPAGRMLKQLKKAYEGSNSGDVLYISKGIHQPNTNPHMQLRLKRRLKNDKGKEYDEWSTFHLNVSVSDDGIEGLPEEFFHWVGVQFTAEVSTVVDGTVRACWPLEAARDTKWKHRRRRMSIAPKDVQGKIEDIARAKRKAEEAKRKAEEEAKQREQARLAQSNRDKARQDITKQLQDKGWTIPPSLNRTGINKLINGETIEVETKKKNKVKVKFEGGTVKQSF